MTFCFAARSDPCTREKEARTTPPQTATREADSAKTAALPWCVCDTSSRRAFRSCVRVRRRLGARAHRDRRLWQHLAASRRAPAVARCVAMPRKGQRARARLRSQQRAAEATAGEAGVTGSARKPVAGEASADGSRADTSSSGAPQAEVGTDGTSGPVADEWVRPTRRRRCVALQLMPVW